MVQENPATDFFCKLLLRYMSSVIICMKKPEGLTAGHSTHALTSFQPCAIKLAYELNILLTQEIFLSFKKGLKLPE